MRANGLDFHVVERGDPAKPLLLCMHGFPECWFSWRWWLVALSGDFHVVAVDNRGFGGTSRPPSGAPSWFDSRHYAVRNVVADVLALVPALGHKSATLAAHDWGAVAAWAVAPALEKAGMLDKLIIINGPAANVYSRSAGLKQYLRSLYIAMFQVPWLPEFVLSRGGGDALHKSVLSHGMGVRNRTGPLALTQADSDVAVAYMSQPGALTAALNWYRQLADLTYEDNRALLPRRSAPLRAPTLVLWGTEDGALGPELVPGHAQLCSDFRAALLPGCSHWAQQDAVEAVLREAGRHLGVTPNIEACYEAARQVAAAEGQAK